VADDRPTIDRDAPGATTCDKVPYPTHQAAISTLTDLIARGRGEQRAYPCSECSAWHLTSTPRKDPNAPKPDRWTIDDFRVALGEARTLLDAETRRADAAEAEVAEVREDLRRAVALLAEPRDDEVMRLRADLGYSETHRRARAAERDATRAERDSLGERIASVIALDWSGMSARQYHDDVIRALDGTDGGAT
jgi:hypothetical protein